MYEPIHFHLQTTPSGWETGKGPGRISSTAEDLLKWDQALYGGKMVKHATLEQAFTPGN